jgi:perosamine synthetase
MSDGPAEHQRGTSDSEQSGFDDPIESSMTEAAYEAFARVAGPHGWDDPEMDVYDHYGGTDSARRDFQFNHQSPWPLDDDDVRSALLAAYADGSWGRYHGPNYQRLHDVLAAYHGVPHVSLCCSGTIAVELALRGLKIAAGDEVILAAYDFAGNFRAIEAIGARPVLVDIDPDTWCLDADQLPAAVSEHSRAIVVSHLHGGLAPMRRIVEFARQHGMVVLEDACQSPGARVDGRVAGTWGDAGVLSFGGSKLLTAGRGGAILTSQADVHQRIKIFAHRGNDAFPLSELQAAVLVPQWAKLDERNERRRASVARLLAQLADLDALRPVQSSSPGNTPSYYKLAWRFDAGTRNVSREDVISAFHAAGLPIDAGFRGFADRSDRRCRRVGALEHARIAARDTILLHHPVLLQPPSAIDRLAAGIRQVLSFDRPPENLS